MSRRETFKTDQSTIQQVLDDEASELIYDAPVYRIDGQLLGDLGARYSYGDVLEVTHRTLILPVEISNTRTTFRNQEYEREVIVKSLQ